MGLTKVATKLVSVDDPTKSYEGLFQVDTRATDCMVAGDKLQALGVKKIGRMRYELAAGSVSELPFGLVRIELMGETTAGRVLFGEHGCEPILGVTALESVGMTVDPANKTLKRLPAMPMK